MGFNETLEERIENKKYELIEAAEEFSWEESEVNSMYDSQGLRYMEMEQHKKAFLETILEVLKFK